MKKAKKSIIKLFTIFFFKQLRILSLTYLNKIASLIMFNLQEIPNKNEKIQFIKNFKLDSDWQTKFLF